LLSFHPICHLSDDGSHLQGNISLRQQPSVNGRPRLGGNTRLSKNDTLEM